MKKEISFKPRNHVVLAALKTAKKAGKMTDRKKAETKGYQKHKGK